MSSSCDRIFTILLLCASPRSARAAGCPSSLSASGCCYDAQLEQAAVTHDEEEQQEKGTPPRGGGITAENVAEYFAVC